MIQFLNPAMLWALPLVLAPLLLRQRRSPREPPTVPYAAMRFLRVAKPVPSHHRLLTAVRIGALAFLILAFARPYFSSLIPHPSSLSSVAVIADNRHFLETALGSISTNGNRVLDFAPHGEIQTDNVAIRPGPYFHPALSQIASLHSVQVHRWVKLPVGQRTIVLIRFSNGDPFLTEDAGVIRCAVAAAPDWSDLPFHANFVPLVNELVRYLATTPPLHHPTTPSDFSRFLLLLVLVLVLVEFAIGGFTGWKLVPFLLLLIALLHPTFTWPVLNGKSTLTIYDHSDSVVTRRGRDYGRGDITGNATDLGSALLSLTNRSPARVVLRSDGQHNHGIDPVWAAARLGAPVVIPFDSKESPRDISITRIECPHIAAVGQTIEATVTITATGYTNQLLRVSFGEDQTNVPPGTFRFCITVKSEPSPIRVEPLPEEATTVNNARPLPQVVIPRPLRVFLRHSVPDWEYQHVRHVLETDPLVELVDNAASADSIIATTNATWRLRRYGDAAFTGYWRAQIRSLLTSLPEPQPVSEEFYQLTRNEELLRDIARVSGGEFQDVVYSRPYQGDDQFDLRNSWIVLAVLFTGFLGAWARRRMLN